MGEWFEKNLGESGGGWSEGARKQMTRTAPGRWTATSWLSVSIRILSTAFEDIESQGATKPLRKIDWIADAHISTI
jgi:hypothetical protein